MSGPKYLGIFLSCTAMALLALFVLHVQPAPAVGDPLRVMGPPSPASGSGWVEMPAGARSAYMGIHGGTVPVSLLAAKDGQSMVTFVGRTGNDFLSILHKNRMSLPTSIASGTLKLPANNATAVLMANSPAGSIPVFYCTGKGFARMDLAGDQWLPFGLSEKPLLLEGQAGRPLVGEGQGVKKYRRVLLQQRLQRPVLSSK